MVELLDQAKAAMSAGDPESPIRALFDSSLLVLDDLGAERPTDWALDAIAALVQHRHSRTPTEHHHFELLAVGARATVSATPTR